MKGLTLGDCDSIIFVAVTENEAICYCTLLKSTDYAREGAFGAELPEVWEDTEAASPQGWVAPLRALRKTDDFSMWIWHGDRLDRWDTAHQAQAVPAVGLGWKNLSSSINVCMIPRLCFTLL